MTVIGIDGAWSVSLAGSAKVTFEAGVAAGCEAGDGASKIPGMGVPKVSYGLGADSRNSGSCCAGTAGVVVMVLLVDGPDKEEGPAGVEVGGADFGAGVASCFSGDLAFLGGLGPLLPLADVAGTGVSALRFLSSPSSGLVVAGAGVGP